MLLDNIPFFCFYFLFKILFPKNKHPTEKTMTAITIGEVLAGLKGDVDGFIDQGHTMTKQTNPRYYNLSKFL